MNKKGVTNRSLETVKIFDGETMEKKALVNDITEAVVKDFEIPSSSVAIDIVDLSKENLAIGGTLFTDH